MSRDGPLRAWLRHLGEALDRNLGLTLLLSGLLLVLGWLLPVLTVRTFYIFYEKVSILGGILRLWQDGDYALFILIALFTVAFPVAKLFLALVVWLRMRQGGRELRPLIHRMETLGRWSMLDVFVVALLVVVIKLSLVTEVEVHAGLYVFCAAVILSMLSVRRVVTLCGRLADG